MLLTKPGSLSGSRSSPFRTFSITSRKVSWYRSSAAVSSRVSRRDRNDSARLKRSTSSASAAGSPETMRRTRSTMVGSDPPWGTLASFMIPLVAEGA